MRFECAVGEIGLQVDNLGLRHAGRGTKNNTQGRLSAGRLALCQCAVSLQGESLGKIDARVGEGQKDEHDGKDALEMRSGEFGLHVLGDKVAEIHDHLGRLPQHGQAGVQFFGTEREWIAQLAHRFESAQGIKLRLGKKREGADQIGSAEHVSDLRGGADPRHKFARGPRAHRGEIKIVIAIPLRGVLPGMFTVFGRLLQRGKGTRSRQLTPREEGAEFGRRDGAGRRRPKRDEQEQEPHWLHDLHFCPLATRG